MGKHNLSTSALQAGFGCQRQNTKKSSAYTSPMHARLSLSHPYRLLISNTIQSCPNRNCIGGLPEQRDMPKPCPARPHTIHREKQPIPFYMTQSKTQPFTQVDFVPGNAWRHLRQGMPRGSIGGQCKQCGCWFL